MGRPQQPGADSIGTLDLLILCRLAHGRIEQISGEILAVNQGTLYPLLLKLEQEGSIASQWGVSDNNRRARFYKLTPRGRKQVVARISNWRRMVDAINRVIDPLVS